jgi:DNA-binding PadR family transcriptional regulator
MGKVLEKFETEVKRGAMQLGVLCLLDNEQYGYEIIKTLDNVGLKVEEGTLYPILKRLENDKLLSSRWETSGPRPRKYYKTTKYGKEIRIKWLNSHKTINKAIEKLEKKIMAKSEVIKNE